jgi:hypothetical protein
VFHYKGQRWFMFNAAREILRQAQDDVLRQAQDRVSCNTRGRGHPAASTPHRRRRHHPGRAPRRPHGG